MIKNLSEILNKAKIFILDFDGTLVDSNSIKIGAFEKCFSEYSDQLSKIMAYCQRHHHTPRHVKFQHVFENILKIPYTEKMKIKMLRRYAKETTEQVIAAAEIPGATAFLQHFYKSHELVLLSSTPHEILLQILERRRMKKYFKTVQGAPVDKQHWLEQFVKIRKLKKEELVFFGDSAEDATSAERAGVPFVSVGAIHQQPAICHLTDFYSKRFPITLR